MRNLRILLAAGLLVAAAVTPAQDDPGIGLERADALYAEENWSGAAEAYRAVTEAEPDNAEAWLKLGLAFHKLEQYKQAAEAFTYAQEKGYEPEQLVMFNLAKSYAADGATGLAVEWLGALAESGTGYYLAVKNAPEFQGIKDDADYRSALDHLKPCNTRQHRQFDFWVGTWDVTSAANPGRTATNRISATHDGCVILEQYDAPGGYSGTSLSFYDQNTDTWHQTWIDNQGAPLFLRGGFKKGSMVLINDSKPESVQRVTWTALNDGRVRQHWESSPDDGETWTTVFDGTYTKKDENPE